MNPHVMFIGGWIFIIGGMVKGTEIGMALGVLCFIISFAIQTKDKWR